MKALRMVIADKDEEFVMRFNEYLSERQDSRVMIVKSFTQFERFQQYFTHVDNRVVLLVSGQWLQQLVTCRCDHRDLQEHDANSASVFTSCQQLGRATLVIVLDDVRSERTCDNVSYIVQYQPLNDFLDEVCALSDFRWSTDQDDHSSDVQQLIISFFSAVGGIGKSTAVFNAVKRMTEQKQRVLLINLEALSGMSLHVSLNANEDFSKLLYYLKLNEEEAVMEWLHQHIQHDSKLRCDYIAPPSHCRDYMDTSAADIRLLIHLLQRKWSYDAIVIDLDSSLSTATRGALEVSDRIIWLVTDDVTCCFKTQQLMHELPHMMHMTPDSLQKRTIFTMSKFLGHSLNEYDGLPITRYLPYVPQWKMINDVNQLYESEAYTKSIDQLMHDAQQERLGQSEGKGAALNGASDLAADERSDSRAVIHG